MTDETRYEATIRVHLPGNVKTTEHVLIVDAADPADATIKAIDQWKKQTNPTDIRVREVKTMSRELDKKPVITA